VIPRLARYVLYEAAGLYAIGVASLCLLLSIDLLSVLARFLVEQGATWQQVGRLLLFKLPWFLHLTLPVATVFAVLLVSGRLAKDAELRAAYAGAVPPTALLIPLFAGGVLASGLAFVNNGWLEPWGEAAYQREIQAFLYVRPPSATQTDAAFAVPGQGVFAAARIRAEPGSSERAELLGVLALLSDGRMVTAARGSWDALERTWQLSDAEVTTPEGGRTVEPTLSLAFTLEATPEETLARPQQQTVTELARRVAASQAAGADAGAARFELQRRIADASSAAVFALVAAALGLRVRGRSGAFGWTIALLVAFWAAWTVTGGLFESGVLGPVAAAWATPAAVALIGVALGWRVTHR